MAKAKPLFKGHYQPRIPADLGFYDLRLPETREMQAEYARKAGIEGFMYWQYYFGNGKMLLQRPFEEVLKSGKPDYPFCLGWANHSWQTDSWSPSMKKKEGKTIIMEQFYGGEKQYAEHFMYNLPAFKDKRYMTVDGKPIFVIWNPADHTEEISLLMKTWRRLAVENGLSGIHFIGSQGVGIPLEEMRKQGFDAVYQNRQIQALINADKYTFWVKLKCLMQKLMYPGFMYPITDVSKRYRTLATDDAKLKDVYPTLISGYDRSPRSGKEAIIFHNFTPEVWRKHVRDVFSYIKDKDYEHNIVMLKSWNEWGESNYMEPDQRYGTAFLDILKEEINRL